MILCVTYITLHKTLYRDFAEERGHKECASFLSNPEKAFQAAKKRTQATKVREYSAQKKMLSYIIDSHNTSDNIISN